MSAQRAAVRKEVNMADKETKKKPKPDKAAEAPKPEKAKELPEQADKDTETEAPAAEETAK